MSRVRTPSPAPLPGFVLALVWTPLGTAVTHADGVASFTIASKYVSTSKRPVRATFAGDASFLTSTGDAFAYR